MSIFEELANAVLTATPEMGRKIVAVKSAKRHAGRTTWCYHVVLEGGQEVILMAGSAILPAVKIIQ